MKKSGKKEIFNSIRLMVFCGNPGRDYSRTRHNIPWLLLHFLDKGRLAWQKKFKGFYAAGGDILPGVILLKPMTFMNMTGESIRPAAGFFRISPAEILVCHDDIELDFGTVSFKFNGGSAGHNGLRSSSGTLGTNNFLRFRLGISRPSRGTVESHVLGRFTPHEEALLPDYMEAAAGLLRSAVTGDSDFDASWNAAGNKNVLIQPQDTVKKG